MFKNQMHTSVWISHTSLGTGLKYEWRQHPLPLIQATILKFNSSLSTGFNKICYHMPKIPVSLSSPLPVTFTVVQQQESLFQWQAKLTSGLKPSSRSCFQVCPQANEYFLWRAAVFYQHFNSTEIPTETSYPPHLKQQPEGKKTTRHLHRLIWSSISSSAIRIRYWEELQRVEVKTDRGTGGRSYPAQKAEQFAGIFLRGTHISKAKFMTP